MRKAAIILYIIMYSSVVSFAQSNASQTSETVNRYLDSLAQRKVAIDSLIKSENNSSDPIERMKGEYYKLFVSPVFSPEEVRESSGIDNPLMNLYLKRPDLISGTQKEIDALDHKKLEEVKTEKPLDIIEDIIKPADTTPDTDVNMTIVKPKFWHYAGEYYLQFLQNYVSDNWYKGGESNYSMLGKITLEANYNNKQKVKFDNKLEMKLGMLTSKADSLHTMKTNEDLLRLTSKFGLQATKNWYYTLQLIAYTQFLNGYKSNDPMVHSGFLAPLNVNLSLGMDYNVKAFKNKLTGNIHLAPFAYNFRYVKRRELATTFGLDEGKRTLHEFGSEFTVDLKWAFSDVISWNTRLFGYTSYHRTEVEWENTFNFKFNRFISANLFVYPRFDDAGKKDEDKGYFQLKEYLSIGFAYSF